MWRNNGEKCGRDRKPAQCDPEGEKPCCNDRIRGECGNTTEHCSCEDCTDYNIIYRDWKDSGGQKKWRYDGKCGRYNTLPDGSPGECDPDGEKACCDYIYGDGDCGNTTDHCSCRSCRDFKYEKEWWESENRKTWRDDGKCGNSYPLPDGSPAECDPDGKNPCCDGETCGIQCRCYICTDFKFERDWRESGGKLKWRYDGRCRYHFLPDGSRAECNPDGENPCCEILWNRWGVCRPADRCFCEECVNYEIVNKIRVSGRNCTVAKMPDGFLKNVCFDEKTGQHYYKCIYCDVYYPRPHFHLLGSMAGRTHLQLIGEFRSQILSESQVCENDPHVYQVCGFGTQVTNSDFLCGGLICEKREGEFEYIKCTGDNCKSSNRDCKVSSDENLICDGKCDDVDLSCCGDEAECNGFKYIQDTSCGAHTNYRRTCAYLTKFVPNACDFDESSVQMCYSYYTFMKLEDDVNHISYHEHVPLFNYSRCTIVTRDNNYNPYCVDYIDQTNCTDIERVGGYCLIGGFLSTVSKFVVCYYTYDNDGFDVKLCDDELQNECKFNISTNCVEPVHKHRMCDGVFDCPDAGDENHDSCWTIKTKEFDFNCTRRFNLEYGNSFFPSAWIMDGTVDCLNGEDEDYNSKKWKRCPGKYGKFVMPNKNCQNAFKCPGSDDSYVPFDQLCDGVESCGDGGENEVCRIARDFPVTITTAPYKDQSVRDVCHSDTCEIKEFSGLWDEIEVFGMTNKQSFLVPTSKVLCNDLFGEDYLFLSCMDLCSEADVKCPLDDMTGVLAYNSCPGQFQSRAYTVANNSFLVFLDQSDRGFYHQEFYECKNSRCVEYRQVCDLVDDCGDMSDEINCVNHMICEDTLNSRKHQFIALSQKCDGIYDCFDLSDECNDGCGREILENWALKIICWFMGTLALLFNFFTMTQEFASIKECRTENMLTSKVLMGLIGLGDCLIGLYLVILSIYDSIIMGKDFCVRQAEWLTGKACLTLGVISTFGSQISLFTMTVLSFIRMYGLIFKAMRVPGPVNKKAILRVLSLSMAMITVALAIAVVPLAPFLDDYFVQGMYYDPAYKVFVGFPNKERHIKILQTYENITRNAATIPTDMSWEEIGIKVDKMFSQDHGTLTRIPVHFYGNDGLCLFKFFVRTDDARRSRQPDAAPLARGDPVVWAILAVNFFCFLIITCCYIVINIQTKKSSKRSGQKSDRNRLKSERAIQNKIMIIIATDFLCWVPFILISALHSFETIDASKWYTSFSMTVLPLNSVINPLVYDKALGDFITGSFAKLRSFIRRLLNMSNEEQEQEQENIPIETICSNLTIHNPTVTSAKITGGSPQQVCEETM